MASIRTATLEDWPAIWAIFSQVVRAGDTYAYPTDIDEDTAKHLWMDVPQVTYVAENDGDIVGTYYLKPNQMGPGSHVCNAGYMVSELARGQGLGRALCLHSLDEARRLGFKAMQYNSVVATNATAIHLWQDLGFHIAGTLPLAFHHDTKGYVDALVMYQAL